MPDVHRLAVRCLAALTVMVAGCRHVPQPFVAEREVDRWVALWEEYDLDRLPHVFLWDSSLTYFSSERVGLIRGADAVREHYRSMGFVEGGRAATQSLWIEEMHASVFQDAAVVTAVWLFGDRDAESNSWQLGPMTAVYRWDGGRWRIAHMHFANYPP